MPRRGAANPVETAQKKKGTRWVHRSCLRLFHAGRAADLRRAAHPHVVFYRFCWLCVTLQPSRIYVSALSRPIHPSHSTQYNKPKATQRAEWVESSSSQLGLSGKHAILTHKSSGLALSPKISGSAYTDLPTYLRSRILLHPTPRLTIYGILEQMCTTPLQ